MQIMEDKNTKSEDADERITETRSLNLDVLHGDHETQESEGGEADLHKYYTACDKNPGHQEFIPVETFSLIHLPGGHQYNDLYEWIKIVIDLTVRVDVKMTSLQRLEFWPETKDPYPFYNLRGKSDLRTGTGMVRDVEKFTDGDKHRKGYTKCWCTECKHSDHPSSVWWEFDVHTATHLVFDDIEASHTSLRLFNDISYSPVDSNKVSDCEISRVIFKYDWCALRCVTCDKNTGDKLYRSERHYIDIFGNVYNKYKNSEDRDRMTFIVSHPHGCSKQVSVGQWKELHKVDRYHIQCTYTTCTCPGSSGAQVFCVGFNGGWWLTDLVHSGAHKSGLNYSGVGYVLA